MRQNEHRCSKAKFIAGKTAVPIKSKAAEMGKKNEEWFFHWEVAVGHKYISRNSLSDTTCTGISSSKL